MEDTILVHKDVMAAILEQNKIMRQRIEELENEIRNLEADKELPKISGE